MLGDGGLRETPPSKAGLMFFSQGMNILGGLPFFFQYTPLKALASMGLESDSKGAPKDWTQLLSTPPDEKPEPGQDSKKNRNLTGCLEDG